MAKEKEAYSNIFEAASKIGKSQSKSGKKELPEEKSTLLFQKIPTFAEVIPTQFPEDSMTINERFEKCQELHKKIKEKAEKAFEVVGFGPQQLRKMLAKPSDFPLHDWNAILLQKKEVDEALRKICKFLPEQKKKEKTEKPRHAVKKSRWIPIR